MDVFGPGMKPNPLPPEPSKFQRVDRRYFVIINGAEPPTGMQVTGNELVSGEESGATVVITHRVKHGHQNAYEAWLNEISPICRQSAGHLDVQIIRPIDGVTTTYTVIIRYDTQEHLQMWLNSRERKALIERVREHLVTDDDFFIRSGLDFWFTPDGAEAKVPMRWKQFLVTWSAIYPLVLIIPLLILPLLRLAGIPGGHYWDTLIMTGVVVSLMVYVVMPQYTKLIQHWLFD